VARCFLLGAGFSNAVADLPVMRQLAAEFCRIRDREIALGRENRAFWGKQILQFFDELEDEFFSKPCVNVEAGESYERCTFRENFESVVSFIDLNLSGEFKAEIIRGENRLDFSKDVLFWNRMDLKNLRVWIQTYLYLALIEPVEESPLLLSFISHMLPGDTIVTFNYDLIVERALFRRKQWSPKDGYGIQFNNTPPINEPDFSTIFPLHKIHGSLNWEGPDMFQPRLELEFFYDDGSPIFPGCLTNEKPRRDQSYQGGHSGCWLMPSFVKQFAVPELLQVWQNAFEALRKADEVVAVGYSLPSEDSAACLLFGTSGICQKRLTLVNWSAENLVERYAKVTGCSENKILTYSKVDDYLAAT
jgi:hypothetical protein